MRPLFYTVTPFGAALWFSEFMISWKKRTKIVTYRQKIFELCGLKRSRPVIGSH